MPVSEKRNPWSDAECYFAVWAYDQLDEDPYKVKSQIIKEISRLIGRSVGSVSYKLQNISAIDPRPRSKKPTSEMTHYQKELATIFKWYWVNKKASRQLYDSYLEALKYSGTRHNKLANYERPIKPTFIEEGEQIKTEYLKHKRSNDLVKYAREYYRNRDPESKLRCQCCGFVTPSKVRPIVEIHHLELISEYGKNGRKIPFIKAVKKVAPLCPNCHRVAHTESPPIELPRLKRIIKLK